MDELQKTLLSERSQAHVGCFRAYEVYRKKQKVNHWDPRLEKLGTKEMGLTTDGHEVSVVGGVMTKYSKINCGGVRYGHY